MVMFEVVRSWVLLLRIAFAPEVDIVESEGPA